jgi:hypothetical protein
MHRYSEEQVTFITDNVKGRSNKELTELVNSRFGLNLTTTQLSAFKKN